MFLHCRNVQKIVLETSNYFKMMIEFPNPIQYWVQVAYMLGIMPVNQLLQKTGQYEAKLSANQLLCLKSSFHCWEPHDWTSNSISKGVKLRCEITLSSIFMYIFKIKFHSSDEGSFFFSFKVNQDSLEVKKRQ